MTYVKKRKITGCRNSSEDSPAVYGWEDCDSLDPGVKRQSEGRRGDRETRRQGDKETGRQGCVQLTVSFNSDSTFLFALRN